MNSQQPSGVNSSASESVRSAQSASDQGVRAKAGEAVSRLADVAQQAEALAALASLAGDAVEEWVRSQGGAIPGELAGLVDAVSREGGTPLVVARDAIRDLFAAPQPPPPDAVE